MDSDFELTELTAAAAAQAIRQGDLPARRYAETLLGYVARSDLGAVIAVDPQAVLSAADAADRKRESGGSLGLLHGVPFVVKDNIDAAGLPASAGTPSLRGNRPARDAAVVAAVKGEGGILLGKTNMHELAAGVTTDNAAFGRTHNPYDAARSAGGSSGGTAAAVGGRLAPLGLGTDTGASNRLPAAFCGIFGFRPTIHRWPQGGLIANSLTRDTIGPMARTMDDIILADSVVTGCRGTPVELDVRTLRIGTPRDPFWQNLDPDVARIGRTCIERLARAGIDVVEADMEDVRDFSFSTGVPIAMVEHAAALNAYLQSAGASFGADHVFSTVASPDVRDFFAQHSQCDPQDYIAAITVSRPRLQGIYHDYLRVNRLDAMIFPTSPILPPRFEDAVRIDYLGQTWSTLLLAIQNLNASSVAGIPGLSIPCGVTASGLPVGMEIDGRYADDRHLLAVGAAIAPLMPETPRPPIN